MNIGSRKYKTPRVVGGIARGSFDLGTEAGRNSTTVLGDRKVLVDRPGQRFQSIRKRVR
jgi:hypothetical protein